MDQKQESVIKGVLRNIILSKFPQSGSSMVAELYRIKSDEKLIEVVNIVSLADPGQIGSRIVELAIDLAAIKEPGSQQEENK